MPRLPLEIIEVTISLLAQHDQSLSSMKACALVCHDFYHLCRKHIFATITLNSPSPPSTSISLTETATPSRLHKLFDTSPEIAHCIRNLTYNITDEDLWDASLIQTFSKITHLKVLRVRRDYRRRLKWNDNPLQPALLHLLYLPTLTEFHLSGIYHFVVSDLAPCSSLEHFEFDHLMVFNAKGTIASNLPETSIRLRTMSVGTQSAVAITKMSAACRADGKSFIDFSRLNKLSVKLHRPEDNQIALDLFGRCKQLTSIELDGQLWLRNTNWNQVSLSRILYPSMQTLQHLHVHTMFSDKSENTDPFGGLCNELQEMANKNVVETIKIDVAVDLDSDCSRGDEWGVLDMALTQSGWLNLSRISLAITIWSQERHDDELERELKNLPQTQFPKLTSSKSPVFAFSVCERRLAPIQQSRVTTSLFIPYKFYDP